MVFNTDMFKDRTSHYKNTLPKVDGNQFVVPNHTYEGSWIRQFQKHMFTCIKTEQSQNIII